MWIEASRTAMSAPCELRVLHELAREAEMLRLNMDESEALRERYQACRRWTTQIHNDLLRRTSLRKATNWFANAPRSLASPVACSGNTSGMTSTSNSRSTPFFVDWRWNWNAKR